MREPLQKRCSLFVDNRNRMKETFRWENSYMHPLCSGILTTRGLSADVSRLLECRDMIKEEVGLFSNFRGVSKLPVITMLAMAENPKDKLEKSLYIYKLLKEEFFTSNYLPIAALIIADMVGEEQYEQVVRKTRGIYKLMKEEHPFLTSSEDSPFAAILALADLDEREAVEEMERCYKLLKPEFFSGNAVQSLSHVLTLGEGSAEEKCRRVLELFQTLKKEGKKYGTNYELATMGVLALTKADVTVLAREMAEADDYLSVQKGFGVLGIGSRQRLMYAGMLTMCDYVDQTANTMDMAAANGVISVIIAEQAAICAAIAATTAASAAASSSSN